MNVFNIQLFSCDYFLVEEYCEPISTAFLIKLSNTVAHVLENKKKCYALPLSFPIGQEEAKSPFKSCAIVLLAAVDQWLEFPSGSILEQSNWKLLAETIRHLISQPMHLDKRNFSDLQLMPAQAQATYESFSEEELHLLDEALLASLTTDIALLPSFISDHRYSLPVEEDSGIFPINSLSTFSENQSIIQAISSQKPAVSSMIYFCFTPEEILTIPSEQLVEKLLWKENSLDKSHFMTLKARFDENKKTNQSDKLEITESYLTKTNKNRSLNNFVSVLSRCLDPNINFSLKIKAESFSLKLDTHLFPHLDKNCYKFFFILFCMKIIDARTLKPLFENTLSSKIPFDKTLNIYEELCKKFLKFPSSSLQEIISKITGIPISKKEEVTSMEESLTSSSKRPYFSDDEAGPSYEKGYGIKKLK